VLNVAILLVNGTLDVDREQQTRTLCDFQLDENTRPRFSLDIPVKLHYAVIFVVLCFEADRCKAVVSGSDKAKTCHTIRAAKRKQYILHQGSGHSQQIK
jgi:hypothetical protein